MREMSRRGRDESADNKEREKRRGGSEMNEAEWMNEEQRDIRVPVMKNGQTNDELEIATSDVGRSKNRTKGKGKNEILWTVVLSDWNRMKEGSVTQCTSCYWM